MVRGAEAGAKLTVRHRLWALKQEPGPCPCSLPPQLDTIPGGGKKAKLEPGAEKGVVGSTCDF